MMKLKEFMDKLKVSERDIVEAAKLIGAICNSFDCADCPLGSNYDCFDKLTNGDITDVGEAIEERIHKLLHPSHMDKVAEILGVKFGEPFKVSDINKTLIYHLEEDGLHLYGVDGCSYETLARLLTGQSYIIKEEKKDE